MGWLRLVAGARWLPYALIGTVAVVVGVSGWSYLKGYASAEKHYLKVMNKAMKEQYDAMVIMSKKDITTAIRKEARRSQVARSVRDVQRPINGCAVSAECLRAFNDGVRAAATDTARADDDA